MQFHTSILQRSVSVISYYIMSRYVYKYMHTCKLHIQFQEHVRAYVYNMENACTFIHAYSRSHTYWRMHALIHIHGCTCALGNKHTHIYVQLHTCCAIAQYKILIVCNCAYTNVFYAIKHITYNNYIQQVCLSMPLCVNICIHIQLRTSQS